MGKGKILVTGGAGYIGSHTVVELHRAGYTPIVIDNFSNSEKSAILGIESIIGSKIKVYEGDCNDWEFLNNVLKIEGKVEGVIHFAAYKAVGESVQNPLKYYQNNVGSLVLVLEMMKHHHIENFVFSSSCTVYGIPDVLPVTEQTPIKKAESPYGNTKQICEDIITDVVKSGANIKSMLLRYFNPIGAHSSSKIGELPLGVPSNLVPFVTQTAAGLRDKLTIFGDDYATKDGSNVRDFIHVVDLAKAHVKSLLHLDKQAIGFLDTINAGTGQGNSVLEVVETFEKVTGEKLNYEIGPRRAGDVPEIYADVTKANQDLGWKTELSLSDALKDAWNWEKTLKK